MKKTHLKKCEGILLNFIILILFNATTANAEDGDLVEAPISVCLLYTSDAADE